MRILALAVIIAFAGTLGACNTTKRMTVKAPTNRDESKVVAILRSGDFLAFALDKILLGVKRGQTVFSFPRRPTTRGSYCNFRIRNGDVSFVGGRQYLGNWQSDLGEVFFSVLSEIGYKVAGDPGKLFGEHERAAKAEYRIGSKIVDMSGNFCREHHWWDGRPLDTYSGEMSVSLEWSVYDTLARRVVLTDKTEGYFRLNRPKKLGVYITFEGAFEAAVRNFAANPKLAVLAQGGRATAGAAKRQNLEVIRLTQGTAREVTIADVLDAVVSVRVGTGHGSGFLVGNDGHILTNAHVVGDASSARVVFKNGIEVSGTVLRRDRKRDIALLKVPLKGGFVPYIERTPVTVTQTVFAIGTPIAERWQSTVTKGIVGALRREARTGNRIIQSDAAISPGNSGGPLVDQNGRVVGVAVAKAIARGAEGIGFFIPIEDALKALSIEIGR